jgi:hypothetical protein
MRPNPGMPFVIVGVVLLLAAGALAAEPATQPPSADWPQWRGPNRDGIAPNSPKLLDAWPKEGPKLLWKSGPIPGSSDGGVSCPVVADGRVFVYADHPKGYVVTSKMLADWGWMDGVPDELAEKIEKARTTRNKNPAGADLGKYINDFLATLDADQAKKFGEHIRKRITMGGDWVDSTYGAAGWWGMASIVNAGVQDKVFSTRQEWADGSF